MLLCEHCSVIACELVYFSNHVVKIPVVNGLIKPFCILVNGFVPAVKC